MEEISSNVLFGCGVSLTVGQILTLKGNDCKKKDFPLVIILNKNYFHKESDVSWKHSNWKSDPQCLNSKMWLMSNLKHAILKSK